MAKRCQLIQISLLFLKSVTGSEVAAVFKYFIAKTKIASTKGNRGDEITGDQRREIGQTINSMRTIGIFDKIMRQQ